jgi:hypothetical protein
MTGAAVGQHCVTSADATKISVNITGTGPPLVVSPGALATEDYAAAVRRGDRNQALTIGLREFVRMPDDATEKIAEFALCAGEHSIRHLK